MHAIPLSQTPPVWTTGDAAICENVPFVLVAARFWAKYTVQVAPAG